MTRGFADCCHYDDGYDDGFEDGKEESGGTTKHVAEAIRFVARERFLYGDEEAAATLERAADDVERDRFFETKLEKEQERAAKLVEAYTEARKAAAA